MIIQTSKNFCKNTQALRVINGVCGIFVDSQTANKLLNEYGFVLILIKEWLME